MISRSSWNQVIRGMVCLGAMLLGCSGVVMGQVVYPPLPGTEDMTVQETPYYIFRSDVPQENLREVVVHMNTMAEFYLQRTRSFSGTINNKLPFYLFATEERYNACGGTEGSDGQFSGTELMAIAGNKLTAQTWHVMQHEGFHQFARAVIGGDLPIWANEGMAEYFGESLYTGDGFVSGVIPQERLDRVKLMVSVGKFMPIEKMMLMTHAQWNASLDATNYDQAWSMVQFLAHGDNGKYQKPFADFMRDVSSGTPWRDAWMKRMGRPESFQRKWAQYWIEVTPDATDALYYQAAAQTFASYIGRAQLQKQGFTDWEQFNTAVATGKVLIPNNDWLPPATLKDAMAYAQAHGQWSLITQPNKPTVVLVTTDDGMRVAAWCVFKKNRVDSVAYRIQLPDSQP